LRSGESVIFLVGFMGAGKTTAGRELARRTGYDFFDLDLLIEARAGKSVSEIFAGEGESEFRRIEREAIEGCRSLKRAVVALGGGAYVSEENRSLLARMGVTIWLDCPLEVCMSRVKGDLSRPLLAGRSEMNRLLEIRRPAYALADYVVEAGAITPEEVADEIIKLLRLAR
jgi:shikimate kinase